MKQPDSKHYPEPGQDPDDAAIRGQKHLQENLQENLQGRLQAQAQAQSLRPSSELAILIVEDDFIINMFIESILSGQGYRIAGVASRGEEAIRLARETSPDLILMDIGLSGRLDGLATALEIRASSEVPIVFMTGKAVPLRGDARLERIRPAAILNKPFDDVRLLAQVAALFPHFSL